jgi:DNA-directed RNA polymerase subunit N (RpoN/RPB10)
MRFDYEDLKQRIVDTYDTEAILDILGLDELEILEKFNISSEDILDEYSKEVLEKVEDFNVLTDMDYEDEPE